MTVEQGTARPVIVHRAILGSVERMLAILTEHFAGNWPLWLSPRQVMVVPISEKQADYAQLVRRALRAKGFHVEADTTDRKMQKKVREAEVARWNYIVVVGEQEKVDGTINVRTRGMYTAGVMSLEAFIEAVLEEKRTHSREPAFKPPPGFQPAAAADGAGDA